MPIKSSKIVGYDESEYLIPDPNGEIKKPYQVAEYSSVPYLELYDGWYASVAQSLYSQVKCGVLLETPSLKQGIDSFVDYLLIYGYPDRTVDLSSVCILFSEINKADKKYAQIASQSASKLLAGVSRSRESMGLWGPVCVNPEFILPLIKWNEKYSAKNITRLQENVQRLRDLKDQKRKIDERFLAKAEAKLETFLDERNYFEYQYKLWGTLAYNYTSPELEMIYPPHEDHNRFLADVYSIQKNGLPYHWSSNVVVDLESTSNVIRGLLAAARNGVLPKKTSAPVYNKKLFARPLETSRVLMATANRVLKLQDKNGGWAEYKLSHPHKIFKGLKLPEEPIAVLSKSKGVNFESTLYACSILDALTICEPKSARYTHLSLKNGRAALQNEIDPFIESMDLNEVSVNLIPSLEQLYQKDRSTWIDLSVKLLFLAENTADLSIKNIESSLDGVKLLASASLKLEDKEILKSQISSFLASGIRPPIFAVWSNDKVVPGIIKYINQKLVVQGESIPLMFVDKELPEEKVANIPFLVLVEKDEPLSEEAAQNLKTYLSVYEGHLVALHTSSKKGVAFVNNLRSTVKKLFPGVSEKVAMSEKGKIKTLELNGRTIISFLYAATPKIKPTSAYQLSGRHMFLYVTNVVQKKLPKFYFEKGYPIEVTKITDPEPEPEVEPGQAVEE